MNPHDSTSSCHSYGAWYLDMVAIIMVNLWTPGYLSVSSNDKWKVIHACNVYTRLTAVQEALGVGHE